MPNRRRFGPAEGLTAQEALVSALLVGFESQPSESHRREHGASQSHASIWQGSLDRRQRIPGGSRAPAGLGAAHPDHFGVLWEFTATRSPASSQVTVTSPPKASEHFGHGDHFVTLHPICTHLQGRNTHKVLTALSCEYSPTRRHRVPLTAVHYR